MARRLASSLAMSFGTFNRRRPIAGQRSVPIDANQCHCGSLAPITAKHRHTPPSTATYRHHLRLDRVDSSEELLVDHARLDEDALGHRVYRAQHTSELARAQ